MSVRPIAIVLSFAIILFFSSILTLLVHNYSISEKYTPIVAQLQERRAVFTCSSSLELNGTTQQKIDFVLSCPENITLLLKTLDFLLPELNESDTDYLDGKRELLEKSTLARYVLSKKIDFYNLRDRTLKAMVFMNGFPVFDISSIEDWKNTWIIFTPADCLGIQNIMHQMSYTEIQNWLQDLKCFDKISETDPIFLGILKRQTSEPAALMLSSALEKENQVHEDILNTKNPKKIATKMNGTIEIRHKVCMDDYFSWNHEFFKKYLVLDTSVGCKDSFTHEELVQDILDPITEDNAPHYLDIKKLMLVSSSEIAQNHLQNNIDFFHANESISSVIALQSTKFFKHVNDVENWENVSISLFEHQGVSNSSMFLKYFADSNEEIVHAVKELMSHDIPECLFIDRQIAKFKYPFLLFNSKNHNFVSSSCESSIPYIIARILLSNNTDALNHQLLYFKNLIPRSQSARNLLQKIIESKNQYAKGYFYLLSNCNGNPADGIETIQCDWSSDAKLVRYYFHSWYFNSSHTFSENITTSLLKRFSKADHSLSKYAIGTYKSDWERHLSQFVEKLCKALKIQTSYKDKKYVGQKGKTHEIYDLIEFIQNSTGAFFNDISALSCYFYDLSGRVRCEWGDKIGNP